MIAAGESEFFIGIKSFRSHYGSGVDSAPKRNEYQARPMRKADNLPTFCAFVTKPGNLSFLEPFWHIQACNGTALPLPLPLPLFLLTNVLYRFNFLIKIHFCSVNTKSDKAENTEEKNLDNGRKVKGNQKSISIHYLVTSSKIHISTPPLTHSSL